MPKRTIPYASVDGNRGQPFTEGLQLASLYILANERRKSAPLSATAPIHYPIQFRRRGDGALLIDMLGLNQTSFKLNKMPDVGVFIRELDRASEDPEAFLKALRSKVDHFKEFSGQQTVTIKGLLAKPGNISEAQDLLNDMVEFDPGNCATVFSPVLKEGDIKGIFDAVDSLGRSVKGDEESLEGAKKGLRDALGIVKKVLKEENQNIKDGSTKIKTRMKRSLKRKSDRLKKRLDREIVKLRVTYKNRAKPLRDERTKRKRRLTRLEKRIERLRIEGATEKVRAERASMVAVRAKYREMDEAIKALEKKRNGEIQEARDRFKAELKVDEDQIREEEARAKAEIQKRLDLGSVIEEEAKGVSKQIDALIKKKRNRLRSLSRVHLNIEVEDTELYIPFYVFQYGEKEFDFHPPVEVAGSRGLFTRFRRMLADTVEGKVGMLIRPRGLFTDKYLAKVIRSLGRKTTLGQIYRQEAEGLNLFRSRGAMDKMMTGLVRMRREGWISDGEYIRLQDGLIDKLGMVTRP